MTFESLHHCFKNPGFKIENTILYGVDVGFERGLSSFEERPFWNGHL